MSAFSRTWSSSSSSPPVAPPSDPGCVVCFEQTHGSNGLRCARGHWICGDCAAHYVKGFTERDKLRRHKGTIPCAERLPNGEPCDAPPFTLQQLAALGNAALSANLMTGLLQQAMANAEAEHPAPAPAQQAALPAPVAAAPVADPKAGAPPAGPVPLTAAELKQQVQHAMEQLQERCLFLTCPHCRTYWDDYVGCSALQCALPTCQQYFCAVCFHQSPNSQACHAHVNSVHGGHYHHDQFLAQHRPARTEKVAMFLLSLPNPHVRRQALIEARELVERYGLQYQQLLTMVQPVNMPPAPVAPAPVAALPAVQPLADAPLNLPHSMVQARIVLWLDRRPNSNRRLKEAAHAQKPDLRIISVEGPEAAMEWIIAHPRLLTLPHRFRIVSNHSPGENLSPQELRLQSIASSLIALLADTHSQVRLLIYCGASLPSAKAYVERTGQELQLQEGQVQATAGEAETLKFITFR